MDDIIDVDSVEQRMAMRKRHAEIGRQMQAVGLRALVELERRVASGEIVLSTEDALELVRAGSEMRRLAQGKNLDDAPPKPPTKPN